MNANWSGLFRGKELVQAALEKITVNNFGKSTDAKNATQWYSVFASGPGIFGLGNRVYADDAIFALYDPAKTDIWSLKNPDHVNGGTNHFGSPFNFPEEFVTVYRLHALVPDLIEYRQWDAEPNQVRNKIAVVDAFRGRATQAMRERGLANWALSMGRQRLGLLTLGNHPQFLQNLELPRLASATGKIDVAALDLIRDREHGVPRFNEFRRQYGLRQLTSFDDFIDTRLAKGSPERAEQERLIGVMREIYGQHRCDASKVITEAQVNADGTPINDCLGHPNGSLVDNIEDVDTVVGWLAEFDAAARLRDLRDAVPGVHPERLAPALQRPVLHLELPAGVLHAPRRRVGDAERSRQEDGEGSPERSRGRGLAAQARAAAHHARADARARPTWSTRSTRGRATAASTTR